MSEHGLSTANPQSDEKRARIQKWLKQEGWTVTESRQNLAVWAILANTPAGFSLLVVQPLKVPDRIDIQAAVVVDEVSQRLIAELPPERRLELLWELRFELLKMGVDFRGFDDPVRLIVVAQRIFDDGLTKDRFLQRVSQIKRAQALTIWRIRRALDQPPPDDDVLSSGYVQ